MSDYLAARLSQFTPDASGLDRDALLFAAGRASVRPNRRWLALAGALAASQLVTLTLLWFQSTGASAVRTPMPPLANVEAVPLEEWPASSIREAPSLLALRDQLLATEGNLASPHSLEPLAPAEPPLHAFAVPPSALFQ